MRPKLNLLTERSRRRRASERRVSGPQTRKRTDAPAATRHATAPDHAGGAGHAPGREPDPAVQRVREAGGPVDQARYTCFCGYVFEAQVSTTVACPHCGNEQAW
jgi:hypothetical protein